MDQPWVNILTEQPHTGQRVLLRFATGAPRIVSYDRFDFAQWGALDWKVIPEHQQRPK